MESPRVESVSRLLLSADHYATPPDSEHGGGSEGHATLRPSSQVCEEPLAGDAVVEQVLVVAEVDGKYVEADADFLEGTSEVDDYDAYLVPDKHVLEEELKRRAGYLLANWIMTKESCGERPSAAQTDEQSHIFTAELRLLYASQAFGNGNSKGKGNSRTPLRFRPLPQGKAIIQSVAMGSGAGNVPVHPGKGYDETHQDCPRSCADFKGSKSIDGGATFRDRPLRDPSGKYYPTDQAHQFQSHPDHHIAFSSHDDIFEHSCGSLDVPPQRDLWTQIAQGNRFAAHYMKGTTSDEMPRGVALSRAAESFHAVLE
jgi:hypothetical protein